MLSTIFIAVLLLGAFVAMLLFLWFNTNVFVEYVNLLHFHGIFGTVEEFNEVAKDDPVLTFPEFLVANHNSFFTRLISCPKCMCVQLSGFTNLPIFILLQPTFAWTAWFWFPVTSLVTAYLGLILYYLLVSLIKRA